MRINCDPRLVDRNRPIIVILDQTPEEIDPEVYDFARRDESHAPSVGSVYSQRLHEYPPVDYDGSEE